MNMTSITESAVSGWDSIPKNSAAVQSYVGFFLYFILFIVSSSRLLVQCGCGPSKEAEEHGGYSNITDEDNETESGNESEWGGGGHPCGFPKFVGFLFQSSFRRKRKRLALLPLLPCPPRRQADNFAQNHSRVRMVSSFLKFALVF